MIEIKKSENIHNVDFLYMELDYYQKSLYNRYGYSVQSILSNVIDDSKKKISKKDQLYNNMLEYFPRFTNKHFAKTIYLDDINTIKKNEVWILKLVHGFLGKDMKIANSNEKLVELKDYYFNKYGSKSVVASQYIQNIRLFNNKKMHLRFWLLVSSFNKKVYVYDQAEIVVGIKDYKLSNWNNMNIHNTHFGHTVKVVPETQKIFFPDEYPYENKDIIMKQIKQFAKTVEYIMHEVEPKVGVYSNQKYGYQVFSCDCLVQDNDNLIIMEMGDKPSFFERYPVRNIVDPILGPWTENYTKFSYDFYKWNFKYGIKPILFSTKK
jgi:hypothetical protein